MHDTMELIWRGLLLLQTAAFFATVFIVPRHRKLIAPDSPVYYAIEPGMSLAAVRVAFNLIYFDFPRARLPAMLNPTVWTARGAIVASVIVAMLSVATGWNTDMIFACN